MEVLTQCASSSISKRRPCCLRLFSSSGSCITFTPSPIKSYSCFSPSFRFTPPFIISRVSPVSSAMASVSAAPLLTVMDKPSFSPLSSKRSAAISNTSSSFTPGYATTPIATYCSGRFISSLSGMRYPSTPSSIFMSLPSFFSLSACATASGKACTTP